MGKPGPAVGSFLYLSGGGMALPCMLIATLGAVTIVLVVMAVPTVEFSKENQGGGGGDEDKNMSMANLLKVLEKFTFPKQTKKSSLGFIFC